MTRAQVAELVGYINLRWPQMPIDEKAVPIWIEDLEPLPVEECGSAVKRYALSGERFPPTSGWVHSEVIRQSQAQPPGFDDVGTVLMRTLGRALAGELYRPDGHYSQEDTARAIQVMADNGAHEAVLRLVAEKGLRAVVMTPDGSMHALDSNQKADRRDMARHYRDVTVKGWQDDPRPGVALERAREALGDGRRGELRQLRALEGGS